MSAGPPPLRIMRRTAGAEPHDWPASVHPALQRVYAARGVTCPEEAGHGLGGLLSPDGLLGLDRALELLADARPRGIPRTQ